MNKKFNKRTKKATALVLAACMVVPIVGSFAYFTDRADTKATATAGSLAINLDDSGIKLTDADGKDILNPGDVRDVGYTVTNVGNKSMDVKETITLSVYDSMGQALNVGGSATTQSEVDLYNKTDVTAYDTVNGYTLADEAKPVQVKTINNNVITYKPDMYTLNGSSTFDEQEIEDGITVDAHTTDLKLVFDKLAANAYQGAVVKMDVLVEAKQHRNTSAYNTDWTELQTETYVFSNGASENVVKAVNADIPEKLQLMTESGVAKAFAPTANMVIPATLDGSAVTGIVDEAYKGETVIETVEIPASVESIGASAFEDCTNLNTLTLNEGLQTIKTAAFKNTALTTVSIPSTVTNVTEDNKLDIFDDGNEIVFVEPAATTADVTIKVYINSYYTNDETLTKIVKNKEIGSCYTVEEARAVVASSLPEGAEPENYGGTVITVKENNNIINVYYKVPNILSKSCFMEAVAEKTGTITFSTTPLTDDITGTDLSTAQDGSIIGVANGNDITIYGKNGKIYTPTDCSGFFYNTRYGNLNNDDSRYNITFSFSKGINASSIDLSGLNTINTINMEDMFYGCYNLTSITFGNNFDTSKVTNMCGMFYYCKNLNEVNVSNFDTSNVTNMSYMFKGCSKLTVLDVSHFNTSKITNMKSMFAGCSGLSSLDVSCFDTSKVTDMSGMFIGCEELTEIDINNFNTSNVTNMSNMFNSCSSLKTLDVSNFDTSKVTDMSGMFYNCPKLTSLNVSSFDTSNVTDMNQMFGYCSLTTLDLSNFDTSNVTNMYSMFSGCSALTNLNLSSFDTSNVTDMGNMFNKCSNLTTLDLSSFDTSNVTKISFMFDNCSNLSITAKTEADKTNFEDSYGFPSTCTVTVKEA